MNMYRRNHLREWFDDVGFLYALVAVVVGGSILLYQLFSLLSVER